MANYNYSKEVEQAKAEGLVPYFVVRTANYDNGGCETGSSMVSFGKDFDLELHKYNNYEDGNLTEAERDCTNLVFELVAIDEEIEAKGYDNIKNALYNCIYSECSTWREYIITINERGL